MSKQVDPDSSGSDEETPTLGKGTLCRTSNRRTRERSATHVAGNFLLSVCSFDICLFHSGYESVSDVDIQRKTKPEAISEAEDSDEGKEVIVHSSGSEDEHDDSGSTSDQSSDESQDDAPDTRAAKPSPARAQSLGASAERAGAAAGEGVIAGARTPNPSPQTTPRETGKMSPGAGETKTDGSGSEAEEEVRCCNYERKREVGYDGVCL